MTVGLHNRSFLELSDFTAAEVRALLDLSKRVKAAKIDGRVDQPLRGKNIALIFEKTSTRTRCAFEVAAYDLGMGVTFLDPSGSQIGHKESIRDTARVLGRMYDAIEYRGFGQDVVAALAAHAGVPVYNGLTDEYHPTQALADLMTMEEHCPKPLSEIAFCYVGDTRNNVANSLLLAAALMNMDVRLCGPRSLWPVDAILQQARGMAATSGARITVTDDIATAVRGVDFIYTDVWVSMGEASERWADRIQLLRSYQVDAAMMQASGNSRCRFMHCLPAFHNRDTTKGEELHAKYGMAALEVTDEVFESAASIVFDQAANRMHTIKAILLATLGEA